ncbi:hypothetical protein KDU71_20605 [Carboxylicivirga sediminis]|uniref:Uncharacterized protein n=1 Tax=Carboxylicivirga sediminis TaxID=2006564 RepID=A0A941F7E0_9BACT|nr:hypothetical protein [Carboxylicivirga sediminis]MBR8537982.1 hypothetical protein [Carboxylicivirga sediminis]
MRLQLCILLLSVLLGANAQVADTLNRIEWQGQMVGWMHYNKDNPYPVYLGGRFIPQANYTVDLSLDSRLDFEASANMVGDVGLQIPDSSDWNGNVSPYRIWGRYSTDQLEVRLGLQKINFGSATLLRPLMWFDQVDPRDPLQLTDGVWGGLMRYYFMNNTNVWVWVLYGSDNVKGWEYMRSNQSIPEFGGRIQAPVPLGEVALSYHHRVADSRHLNGEVAEWDKIPENRLGFDARFDKVVGFWFEGAWVNMNKDMGELTNQVNLNIGLDYTFGIGNGLSIIAEHLVTSYDKKAFAFNDAINITACSLNYPIGMFDNVNTIVFYSWADSKWYNFINWSKQYDAIVLNMMAYWNPDDYNMPLQGNAENLFGGKGIQLMLVYNF